MLGVHPIESDFPSPLHRPRRRNKTSQEDEKRGDYIDNDPRFSINYELLIFSPHTPRPKLPQLMSNHKVSLAFTVSVEQFLNIEHLQNSSRWNYGLETWLINLLAENLLVLSMGIFFDLKIFPWAIISIKWEMEKFPQFRGSAHKCPQICWH